MKITFVLAICMLLNINKVWSALEEVDPGLAEINNFRQYSDTFASAGQPSKEQFQAIKESGFKRVVYIAFSDNGKAFPDEDQLVKFLGMEYMHVPVDFSKPLPSEFHVFADSLQRDTSKKTFLHCQVNFRASAFSFLYRVIYEDVSVAEAKKDMNTVWQPTVVWRDFIFEVLAQNGKSPDCEDCDWTPSPPRN